MAEPQRSSLKKPIFIGVAVLAVIAVVAVMIPRLPEAARNLRWKRITDGRLNGGIDEKELPDILIQLASLAPGAFSRGVEPRFYFSWQTPDGARFVFGGVAQGVADAPTSAMRFTGESIPGGRLYLRLCLFTNRGVLLSVTDVPLGQQSRLASVKLLEERPPGIGCLEVGTIGSLLGARFRQYITPLGHHWALLRITRVDVKEKEVRPQANGYAPDELSLAPPRLFATVDELLAELESGDVRRVLAALHWLCGQHENRQYKARSPDADFVERAREDSRVRAALGKLADHTDSWIREIIQLGEG